MKHATKWFYAALDKAVEIISNGAVDKSCTYQIVTKDRVIELWQIRRSDKGAIIQMFVQVTKQGSKASLMIYEVTELRAALPIYA